MADPPSDQSSDTPYDRPGEAPADDDVLAEAGSEEKEDETEKEEVPGEYDPSAGAEVTVEPYSLRLSHPLQTAQGTLERRRGFVVRVRTDEGTGVGEAAPLPGFTESREACGTALADAAAVAEREGLEAAHDAIDEETHPAAAHGIGGAVLDAVGRALDQPLYRLLGGDRRDRLPVNAVVGDGDPEATAEEAIAAVDAGFDVLKVKVGARDPRADATRLQEVREAVGPETTLRADANGAWTPAEAELFLDAVAPLDLQYLEQPLPPGDLEGSAALRDGPVPIAVDEGLARHGVEAVIAAGVADVLVVKPMAHGSPAAARAAPSPRGGRQSVSLLGAKGILHHELLC